MGAPPPDVRRRSSSPGPRGVTPSTATTVRSQSQRQSSVFVVAPLAGHEHHGAADVVGELALDRGVHALAVAGLEERRALQRDRVRRDGTESDSDSLRLLQHLHPERDVERVEARRPAPRRGRATGVRESLRPAPESPPAQHLGRIGAHGRAASA